MNARISKQVAVTADTLLRKIWGRPQLQSNLHDYLIAHSRVQEVVQELREETLKLSDSVMATTVDQLPVMAMLARLIQTKHIIDVGTYTGISALQFAMTVPSDGQVITIDKSDKHLEMAKRFWKKANVAHKVDLVGDGSDILDSLQREGYSKKIDLAFIDADKLGYDAYYEKVLSLIRPGGLIVMDNVLHLALVADPNAHDPITSSIRALNKKLYQDDRILFCIIPSADGLAVCQVQA